MLLQWPPLILNTGDQPLGKGAIQGMLCIFWIKEKRSLIAWGGERDVTPCLSTASNQTTLCSEQEVTGTQKFWQDQQEFICFSYLIQRMVRCNRLGILTNILLPTEVRRPLKPCSVLPTEHDPFIFSFTTAFNACDCSIPVQCSKG